MEIINIRSFTRMSVLSYHLLGVIERKKQLDSLLIDGDYVWEKEATRNSRCHHPPDG